MILGYFQMAPYPGMDRLSTGVCTPSELSAWMEASNLTDVWRWRHPHQRAYTCHSASDKTFFLYRPSLKLGGSVLSRIRDISILPRSILDHAPLALKLNASTALQDSLWHMSGFWLSDSRVSEPYRFDMIHYWKDRDRFISLSTSWDAFKVFSRGSLQSDVRQVCRFAEG